MLIGGATSTQEQKISLDSMDMQIKVFAKCVYVIAPEKQMANPKHLANDQIPLKGNCSLSS